MTRPLDGSTEPTGPGSVDPPIRTARWLPFAVVTAAFMAVTVAESLLAPAMPAVAADLGLALDGAGVALGTVTGAVAVGNLVGGYLLASRGARASILVALVVAALGCALTAGSGAVPVFLLGQAAIGFGTGMYFPAGLHAAGFHAGSRRRGLAMGLFGVAFSAGLAIAAVVSAFSADVDWRAGFVVAAVGCVVSAGTMTVVAMPPAPARTAPRDHGRLGDALGTPAAVASVASVCQYGTVGFLPTYAVLVWEMSVTEAALLLAAARILSAPAKLLAGTATDRVGAARTVRVLGLILVVSGLGWTVPGSNMAAHAAAVVFAATVSAVFPVSNVLALEQFADRGPLLGLFRSTQIAAGALGAWLVGVAASLVGLPGTLTASVLLPLVLVLLMRTRSPTRLEATAGT